LALCVFMAEMIDQLRPRVVGRVAKITGGGCAAMSAAARGPRLNPRGPRGRRRAR
jgi:hypothetical protein